MSKKLAILCFLSTAGLYGCNFEEAFIGAACPGDAAIAYIQVGETRCKAEDCKSASRCCGMSGKQADLVFKTFKNRRCAADMGFETCLQDTAGKYFCGDERMIICEVGEHLNKDQKCIKDTLEKCGVEEVNCMTEGVDTAQCAVDPLRDAQGFCLTVTCLPKYHLKDNACVPDTADKCGVDEVDCTQNVETGKIICEQGVCNTECKDENEQLCEGVCLNFRTTNVLVCSKDTGIGCAARYVNWDNEPQNGCEVSFDELHIAEWDSVDNVITCLPGWEDCDRVRSNGCEYQIWSVEHCGACGAAKCDDGEICPEGTCVLNTCTDTAKPDKCPTYEGAEKPEECTNVNNDPRNCGQCGSDCTAHIPTRAKLKPDGGCTDKICKYECDGVYINCGGDNVDDIVCLTNEEMKTNNQHCGRCDNPCDVKNGMICSQGICEENKCLDNTKPDLCAFDSGPACVNLGRDPENCGACGYKCADHLPPNTRVKSTACVMGSCQYECESAAFANCGEGDTASTISCRSIESLRYDNDHCATESTQYEPCGTKCDTSQGMVCVNGKCQKNVCEQNQTVCYNTSGNADCKNLNSDIQNCGACGYQCGEHKPNNAEVDTCGKISGSESKPSECIYKCKSTPSGMKNCGSGTTVDKILCLTPSELQYNNSHCGDCNKPCNTPSEVCSGGKCVKNKCTGGQVLCDESTSTDMIHECRSLSSDSSNCGSCGYKCSDHVPTQLHFKLPSSGICVNGACQYECESGYTSTGATTGTLTSLHCVDLKTDSDNCGGIGVKCSEPNNCDSGNTSVVCACVNGECKPLK